MGAGKPPVAFLLEDPSHTEWGMWDFRLATALQVYDDSTNDYGIPYWWDKSDRMTFDAETTKSKSAAAIQRRQQQMEKRNTKPEPGIMLYPKPRVMDGGERPTMLEFVREQAIKRGELDPELG